METHALHLLDTVRHLQSGPAGSPPDAAGGSAANVRQRWPPVRIAGNSCPVRKSRSHGKRRPAAVIPFLKASRHIGTRHPARTGVPGVKCPARLRPLVRGFGDNGLAWSSGLNSFVPIPLSAVRPDAPTEEWGQANF